MQQEPARVPKRKPAPPTLAIPAPAHQAGYQSDQEIFQESQASAERSDRRQKKETRVQRSARHQGWNPFKEQRVESTANINKKDGGRADGQSRDLERQDEAWPYSRPRGWKSADDYGDRRFFFFLVIVAVVGIVVVAVYVNMHWKKG